MEAKRLITTRGLPKTGQTHKYTDGDDGDYEAGWWVGQKVVGNKERFVARTINGDNVVEDFATGLMWPADFDWHTTPPCGVGVFPYALAHCEAMDYGGFEDWRLPNIHELCSLLDCSLTTHLVQQPPFSNVEAAGNWSSTTDPNTTTNAFALLFGTGEVKLGGKTDEYYVTPVRGGV